MVKAKLTLLLLFFFFLLGCTASPSQSRIQIPKVETPEQREATKAPVAEPLSDFIIENPEINPLNLRRISLHLRASPLKDVLFIISRDSGLNLVIERGVDPDFPITVVLTNVTLQDALDTVMDSTDYFYRVERNILRVFATDTKTFWLNISPVTGTYATTLGGDAIGGGATGQTGGQANLRGNISRSEQSDAAAYSIWDTIERAINAILSEQSPQVASATSPSAQQSQQPQQTQQQPQQPQQPPPPPPPPPPAQAPSAVGQVPREYYVINRLTGSITVTATKRKLAKIESYINKVRQVLQRQVIIEARIVEVQLSDSMRYGIDWNLLIDKVVKTVPVNLRTQTSKFIDIIQPGTRAAELGFTITTGDVRSLSGVIRALSEFGDVRILSNPRINVLNGQPALLTVGTNYPFIARVVEIVETDNQTGIPRRRYEPERGSVLDGVMLGIIPYVDSEDNITLTITPILSHVPAWESFALGSQGGSGESLRLPVVSLKQLNTSVRVRDGEVVILGGLISREEITRESKTPLLGDVPLIGSLFKSQDVRYKTTELVILIQPKIVSK